MKFTTENHDPLSINGERLVIPSHLPIYQHMPTGSKKENTHISATNPASPDPDAP